VDVTLSAGEVRVVLGPNGAGKTTLLRILAGLARPTVGSVQVMGRPLRGDDPDARRPIGLLSHHSLLYDDLSLLENLTLAARLYGIPAPVRVAREALEVAELSARADDSPRRLSRGMLQRAAIARALLHRPSILLLDEPFTGLDAHSADRFRTFLRGQREAGRAILLVTHQLGEVWDVASRVSVLVGGRWALEEERPDDLAAFEARYREATLG
jgi:heme exporter protein A